MNKTASYRAFLDESGDTAEGIYAVGGFVGMVGQWESIQSQWQSCLPTGVSHFHSTDCFTGNRQFAGIDISERKRCLERLTDLIVAHEIRLIGYGIDAGAYKRFAPKAKNNSFIVNKYAAPFSGVLELACSAMGNTPDPTEIWDILEKGENWEQCDFFIEKNEYSASARRMINSVRADRSLWFRGRIGNDVYGEKSGPTAMPLLEVADLGAFLARKKLANLSDGKIPWTDWYEKLRAANRIYRIVLADASSLEKLFQVHWDLEKEAAQAIGFSDSEKPPVS